MNALVAANLAFLTTLAGGLFALKAKPHLQVVYGVTQALR